MTGLDFKSAQFDQVRGEAEDYQNARTVTVEIRVQSELEDLK
jgi:hypothetical protein